MAQLGMSSCSASVEKASLQSESARRFSSFKRRNVSPESDSQMTKKKKSKNVDLSHAGCASHDVMKSKFAGM